MGKQGKGPDHLDAPEVPTGTVNELSGSRQPAQQQSGQTRTMREAALVPTLVVITALVSIVSSLGAPLVPVIARTDHVSLSTGQWLLTAALLTGALSTPVMGRLSDGPHQRRIVFVALSLTLGGCVLAAVTNSFTIEVLGRGLQGFGLGLLPVTMAIARCHLDPSRVPKVIATLSITGAVGLGLGYPVTTIIAEAFDFHAAFYFGAIAVACALVLATIVLPRYDVPSRRFDTIGAVTLTWAVIGVTVALSEADTWGWTSARTLGIFLAALVAAAWWVSHELGTSDALVDLRQVRHRQVLMADVAGFLICVAMYLFIPVVVEFVQVPRSAGYGFGGSIVLSGLVLVPLSVGTFTASRFLSVFERRFGLRRIIPLGSVMFAIAGTLLAFEHRALFEPFVVVGLAGLGMGFTFAAMPGFILRSIPHSETGSSTGFYQVLRSIGLSVGSALETSILAGYTHRGDAFPEIQGIRAALLIGAALCAVTAVLSYVLAGPDPAAVGTNGEEGSDAIERLIEGQLDLGGTGMVIGQDHLPPPTH
jgi:MFS family permease